MLSMVLAFVGMPGGIELLVIFFVMFLLFGVPVALALFLGYKYVKGQTKDQRIEELESELSTLRDQVGDSTPSSTDASEPRPGSPPRADGEGGTDGGAGGTDGDAGRNDDWGVDE